MKRAYSRLERDKTGIIRVVFYDADTSLPVDDLTGYSIVAIDNKGQAVPVNQAPPATTPQPVASAPLPRAENPPMATEAAVPNPSPVQRENGGAVSGMDLEPTGRFVGPNGLMGLALGDKNVDGNTGWRNGLLTTGLGLAAGALGGPLGLAAGVVAKGVVNSDSFKNKYNSRGQLSALGVGPGLPDKPEGPVSGEVGLGVPANATPTSQPQTATVGPSGQRSSIPASSVQQASYTGNDMTQAPSMSAFNRREPSYTDTTAGQGYRQGLTPEIDAVAAKMEHEFGRELTSGYRSGVRNALVNGAKNSEHIRGNAIDVDVSRMTNEEKRNLLEAAVQNGVRGVGIYNSGTSIHLDTRQNPMSWGPKGYKGSPVSEMPEWSQNTLSAMYGAGPGGRVLPDKGPTPKSRDEVLAQESIKGSPLPTDMAFQSRPKFSDVTEVQAKGYTKREHAPQTAAEFLGTVTKDTPAGLRNNNPGNLKYTGSSWQQSNLTGIAGPSKNLDEGDPQISFSSPMAGLDSMARLAVGKFDSGMTTVNDLVSGPKGWTGGKQFAADNVAKSMGIKPTDKVNLRDPAQLQSFMEGLIAQEHGVAGTKAYNRAMIQDSVGHMLGTSKTKTARELDDEFTRDALASQVGRNVDNIDKNLSGDIRTSLGFTSKEERDEKAARDRQRNSEGGSLEGSRYSGVGLGSRERTNNSGISSRSGSGKDKDDRGVGLGSRSSSSSKSSSKSSSRSNNSSVSGRSGSGKDKDDRGVGLGSRSTSSASKGSSSKSNAGSDKSTGPSKSSGGGNSSVSGRSGSGKDKDDKGVGSSSNSGGKSSGGSGGKGKK